MDIKEKILSLEYKLLDFNVRKSGDLIKDLVSYNFIEYQSSGGEYHYEIGDIFQDIDDVRELNWKIYNFNIEILSEKYILARYKLIKQDEVNEDKKYSNRSSIWRLEDNTWKMYFHQGTPTSKFEVIE